MSGVTAATAIAVGVGVMAAGSLASTGYSIASNVSDIHKGNEEKHKLAVEKDKLATEQRTIEQKARAEADAKLAQKRSRAGRAASAATSPLGVTDAAPVARASLQGQSLLG